MLRADAPAPGLTPDERAHLDTFGFLVLRGVLAAEADELSAAFDELVDDDGLRVLGCPQFYAPLPTWADHPRVGLIGAADRSPALSRLKTHPRVQAVVCEVVGADHAASDTVSLFSCDTHWHHDGIFATRPGRHLVFLWYLDPLTAESGALRVIPGSHAPGPFRDALVAELTRAETPLTSAFGAGPDALPSVSIDVVPGDAVLLDLAVFHASFHGGVGRRLVTVTVGPGPGTELDPAEVEALERLFGPADPAAVSRLRQASGRDR